MADDMITAKTETIDKEALLERSRNAREWAGMRRQYEDTVNPWAAMQRKGPVQNVVFGLLQGMISPDAEKRAAMGALELYKMQQQQEQMKERQTLAKKQMELTQVQIGEQVKAAEQQRELAAAQLQQIKQSVEQQEKIFSLTTEEQKKQMLLDKGQSQFEKIFGDLPIEEQRAAYERIHGPRADWRDSIFGPRGAETETKQLLEEAEPTEAGFSWSGLGDSAKDYFNRTYGSEPAEDADSFWPGILEGSRKVFRGITGVGPVEAAIKAYRRSNKKSNTQKTSAIVGD